MQVQKEAEEISGIALFDGFRGPGFGQKFAEGRFVEQPWQYFEWQLAEGHEQISDDDLVHAWTVFLERLKINTEQRQQAVAKTITKASSEPTVVEGAPSWWADHTAPESLRQEHIITQRLSRSVSVRVHPPPFVQYARAHAHPLIFSTSHCFDFLFITNRPSSLFPNVPHHPPHPFNIICMHGSVCACT